MAAQFDAAGRSDHGDSEWGNTISIKLQIGCLAYGMEFQRMNGIVSSANHFDSVSNHETGATDGTSSDVLDFWFHERFPFSGSPLRDCYFERFSHWVGRTTSEQRAAVQTKFFTGLWAFPAERGRCAGHCPTAKKQ
jgi:hypothetical protein